MSIDHQHINNMTVLRMPHEGTCQQRALDSKPGERPSCFYTTAANSEPNNVEPHRQYDQLYLVRP